MVHNNEFVLVVAGVSLWYYMHHRARVAPKETYVNKALIEDAGGSDRPDLWNRTWWKTSEAPSSNNPAVNPHKVPLPGDPHHYDGTPATTQELEELGNMVEEQKVEEPIPAASQPSISVGQGYGISFPSGLLPPHIRQFSRSV